MAGFFNRLGNMLSRPQGGMSLNPVTQSVLAQQLLAQSMQSPQGLVSGSGVANKILQGLLAGSQARSAQQSADLTSGRQSALAGALSRMGQGGPQGEAARRAALIISGGLPGDPTAQAFAESQINGMAPGAGKLVGLIQPGDYEPSSVQDFVDSGGANYRALKPRFNAYGKYNPGDYTPASWAEFQQTGDPSALVRFAPGRVVETAGGGSAVVDPINRTSTPVISDESATQAAATRKGQEALAAARGGAVGTAEGAILSRARKANGISEILDIAEPLIDEATGSGTGAGRDKLAAFFGVSTSGAQATAQLLPLQAAIMLNQPRMEGLQSDRDVQLYREAAGQLGDPTVPRENKKAAIQTIRRLQQTYKSEAGGTSTSTDLPDFQNMSDEELKRLAGGK